MKVTNPLVIQSSLVAELLSFFSRPLSMGMGLSKKKRVLVTEAGLLSSAIQHPSSVGTAIGIRSLSPK
jgi:hypothetical protein